MKDIAFEERSSMAPRNAVPDNANATQMQRKRCETACERRLNADDSMRRRPQGSSRFRLSGKGVRKINPKNSK
jgi:hypothetical protein